MVSPSACVGSDDQWVEWMACEECMPVAQETWLISEYCDKGNLDRAVLAGRFHEAVTKKPNLVRH